MKINDIFMARHFVFLISYQIERIACILRGAARDIMAGL